jgi:hypothetical protein
MLKKKFDLLIRTFIALFGISSIVWAASLWPAYRTGDPLENSAQLVLLGQRFTPNQLNSLRLRIAATVGRLRPLSWDSIAVIYLRLVENDLTTGNQEAYLADVRELRMALSTALSSNPNNSFLWLIEYWLQESSVRAAEHGLKALYMSYLLGPNEAWIAVNRNPLTLSAFSSLPSELAERAISEFVGLVRSGLYWDASNILAGSGWAIHEKLLNRLVQINEADRREFAKVLRGKNLDAVQVPGVGERSARPF